MRIISNHRRTLTIALVTLLSGGCGASTEPAPSAPPAAAHEQAAALTISVKAQWLSADQRSRGELRDGDRLKSGDHFCYELTLSEDSFVYVLQFSENGSAAVLYPGAGNERLPAGTARRVPSRPDQWFSLDDATGEESFYIIASREPLDRADAKLAELVGTVRASPTEATAAPAPGAPPASTMSDSSTVPSAQPASEPTATAPATSGSSTVPATPASAAAPALSPSASPSTPSPPSAAPAVRRGLPAQALAMASGHSFIRARAAKLVTIGPSGEVTCQAAATGAAGSALVCRFTVQHE